MMRTGSLCLGRKTGIPEDPWAAGGEDHGKGDRNLSELSRMVEQASVLELVMIKSSQTAL